MRRVTNASGVMPEYLYMPLPTGEADVFIYKPIETEEEELLYETNEFRTSILTESEIAAGPFKYLDYEEKKKTDTERIAELEEQNEMLTECILEMASIIYA